MKTIFNDDYDFKNLLNYIFLNLLYENVRNYSYYAIGNVLFNFVRYEKLKCLKKCVHMTKSK